VGPGGDRVSDRTRVLVLGSVPEAFLPGRETAEVVRVANAAEALRALPGSPFDFIVADAGLAHEAIGKAGRNDLIHAAIDEGIAVLDPNGVVTWANHVLHDWCGTDPTGKPLLVALGKPTIAVETADPFALARSGQPTSFQINCEICTDHEYLEIRLRPTTDATGNVHSIIAITRNVTPQVEQQKRLDALQQAGQDLAQLEADQLVHTPIATRIELLKQNVRRTINDLLHYDIIEIRLLDRTTNELKPLLEDGMTPEAAARVLTASPTGNGVTGFVAHTGRSYLCADASNDPHYITGAADARSSMTVPLKYFDEVIGTLNVESPRVNGFGPDDLQFTELFSREIATALHNLDLLRAQQTTAATITLDAVTNETVVPVDDLLGLAIGLRPHLADRPELTAAVDKILAATRTIKGGIKKVGDEHCPERQTHSTVPGAPVVAGRQPLAGKTILVIDGDPRARKQANVFLGRLGAECITAGTAAAALALFREIDFDAAFVDIKLPDAGTYATYVKLRDMKDDVQVAMMTGFGYDAGHSIVKGRADGMQFTLFKPFRPEQVVKAVTTPPLPRGTQAPSSVGGLG
jgi:CheY-like chemotaxis protein/GAF domain-containing protein